MWQNAHDAYLENRILSADPMELVRLLYQAGMSAVRDARRHLAEGAIMERARSITRAGRILRELETSLDYERGGQISKTLGQLYEYMQRRLVEANFKQSDEPLAEVLGLLTTLLEGWSEVRDEAPAPVQRGAWAQPMLDEAAAGQRSHAWSL